MTGDSWRIRAGSPDDRQLLASFACADSAVRWQVEVEQFVQAQLLEWAFEPLAAEEDPRLLLAFTAARELFGVAALCASLLDRDWINTDVPTLARSSSQTAGDAPWPTSASPH